jgi:hypothetical protein
MADLLGTQYQLGDKAVTIIHGTDGKYTTVGLDTPMTGASFLDVESQLIKENAVRTRRNIVETSIQSIWTPHASALFHKAFPRIDLYGASEEKKAEWAKNGNPYLDPKFAENFAGAREEAAKRIAQSLRDTGNMPKWETEATKYLEDIGGGKADNPAVRGQQGFSIGFGALNDDNNVFISRHRTNGIVSLVEDVIENLEKGNTPDAIRRKNTFVMRDGAKAVYRPSVEAFFRVVQAAANNYAAQQDAIVAQGGFTQANAQSQADKARRVANMFNPLMPNSEAQSKAIVSFGLMLARNSAEIRGAAYYDILTAIAPAVNGTEQALAFRSLVNRYVDPTGTSGLVSGDVGLMDEGGGVLASLMKGMAPSDIRDTGLPGLPGSRGALELPSETGKQLTETLKKARKGDLYQEGMDDNIKAQYVKAVRETYGNPGMNAGYLPEDVPELVRQLAASMLGGNVKGDAGVGPVGTTAEETPAGTGQGAERHPQIQRGKRRQA